MRKMEADRRVMDRIEALERSMAELREEVADSIMTEDDYKALLAYRKEKSSSKLISHDRLKKSLGL